MGLREYLFSEGIAAVEWFERLREHDDLDYLAVRISFSDDNNRRIRVHRDWRSPRRDYREAEAPLRVARCGRAGFASQHWNARRMPSRRKNSRFSRVTFATRRGAE